MPYYRVLPRDLFNEAKLLKCMGRLILSKHDATLPRDVLLWIDENGEPFDIEQDESDGSLWVRNYACVLNGRPVRFCSAYNSRAAYPLICKLDDEELPVFNDDGSFSGEFIARFSSEGETP